MKNYYHIYPTCPNCLEPHRKGLVLEKIDESALCMDCDPCLKNFCELKLQHDRESNNTEYYKCTNCGAVFYSKFNLKEFPNTLFSINESEKFDNLIPYIWEIEPNAIEKSYLEWIRYIDGKYLITWPWDEVKFIPLLLVEYLDKFPFNKVVIIENNLNNSENIIFKPSNIKLYENLLFLDEKKGFNEDLEDECNSFNRKNILKKVNKYFYHIKLSKYKDLIDMDSRDFSNFLVETSLRDFKNDVVKIIMDKYGTDSISSVVLSDRVSNRRSEGFIDLKFFSRISWSNKDIRAINKKNLWENLSNINGINRVKFNFPNYELIDEDNEDSFDINKQIFFLSYQNDNIFSILDKINPNLVIFSNSDYFIEHYKIYKSIIGEKFVKYLGKTNADCLLFSIKKDSRHLYDIFNQESFINNLNFKVHTWDNNLLENIDDNSNVNAGTSSFKELSYPTKLNICLEKIPELDRLEEVKIPILKYFQNGEVSNFFNGLLKTPLYLTCRENLNYHTKNYTFDYFRDFDFYDEEDEKIFMDLLDVYNKYYKDDRNPILSKIIKIIERIIDGSKRDIYVIANYYEKNKLKKILDNSSISNYMDCITVLTWNQLNSRIDLISEDSIIISSTYPNISYEMYYSKVKNFIFLGSCQNLKYIKLILDNRIDENFCTPIFKDIEEDCPSLLKEIYADFKEPTSFNINLKIQNEIKNEKKLNNIVEGVRIFSELQSGEECILFLDNHNNALFVPLKHNITFVNSNQLDEQKINEKNFVQFRNRKIIIKHDFMISFKEIFSKFMIENADRIKISSELCEWNSFRDIINDAYDWRNKLNELVKIYQIENSLSEDESKKFLSEELVKTSIYANDPNYVKNFWLRDPIKIKTSKGLIGIYDIESPRGKNDLLEIYSLLSKYMDAINPEFNSLKTKVSIKTLKYFRNSFLKGKNIIPEYRHLYSEFNFVLKDLLDNSEVFKVQHVQLIKLTKNVHPFKIINDFEEFYN